MIAKEIAYELLEKMSYNDFDEHHNCSHYVAKNCALIAVEFSRQFITGDLSETFDKTMFLFDIKQEIEKL